MKTLYTATATTTGGRDGHGKSSDGLLDVKLSMPKELGGANDGANPEQLFAVGYAACFIGAIKHVASQEKIALPADLKIDSAVSLGTNEQGAFELAVTLSVFLPEMNLDAATELVNKAHEVCPYSRATRGNISVELGIKV